MHPLVGLVGWIALVAIAAALGTIASLDAASFYRSLSLPSWAPPPGVFGPVWMALYVAMAVAAWLVWKREGWRNAGGALALFCVQLALNALWSWLFFAWHKGMPALVDLALLWIVVLVVTVRFFRVSKLAGALLVPYAAWLTFAGALNYAVLQRNPAQLGAVGSANEIDERAQLARHRDAERVLVVVDIAIENTLARRGLRAAPT